MQPDALDILGAQLAKQAEVILSMADKYGRDEDYLLRVVTVCRVGGADGRSFDFSNMASVDIGETHEEEAEVIAKMLEDRAQYIREHPAGKMIE